MAGQALKHYEILDKLGEGGMGVVYKARDTHLDRFVAIKILQPGRAADPERRQRFIREAKAASALNHPGIIHVYDIDSENNVDFMVMEFVKGKNLAQCIGRKGMALPDALNYAIQVADALAAAHAAGIVHRDLKPANIMVTENRSAKVLDFGLAKLIELSQAEVEHADTGKTQALTGEGMLVGTAAYMSPEQAECKRIDARSDIFSFGSVLYELVTGRRAFAGESCMSILSSILQKEPVPVRDLVSDVPRDLDSTIRRCLRKDPEYRFQHMDDVRVLLREIQEESGTDQPVAGARIRVPRPKTALIRAAAAVVLLLAGTILGAYLGGRRPIAGEPHLRKFRMDLKGEIRALGLSDSSIGSTISPDGKMVAYTQSDRLWIRHLSRLKAREIPDTQGASGPFWSPDSEYIAYAANGALRKIPAQGGPASTLCELPRGGNFLGGTWGTAGSIVVGISAVGLFQVSTQGGEPKALLSPDQSKGEFDFHSPHYLPDGKTLLFAVHPISGYQFRLAARSGQNTQRVLGESAGNVAAPVYAASGHLIYERISVSRTIYAVPFSLSSLSASGEPFQVAEDGRKPSVSLDGTLLYELSRPEELVMVDRSGKFEKVVAGFFEQIRYPVLSPGGERVAFMGVRDGNHDIWISDLARGSQIRLTTAADMDQDPAWSPLGVLVAYASGTTGKFAIVSRRSDGSGEMQPLVSARDNARAPEWSPDGKSLVYIANNSEARSDIRFRSLNSDGQSRPFLETPFTETNPKISPDSRMIAYTSNESGRNEVYVRPFPRGPGRWLVSVNGGSLPRWSRRGNELFYVEGNAMMTVSIEAGASFHAGAPQRLFRSEDVGFGLHSFSPSISAYDVSPDGQHFIVVRFAGGTENYLTVVQNWLEEFQNTR